MSTFDAHLSENSLGNLELSVGTAIGYPFRSFQTCPFSTGPGVSDPWTDLDTPFSKKQIFRAQKAFDIKARASFTAEKPTRTTGVTWTLKLKPVK
jgi:hypothetical protein